MLACNKLLLFELVVLLFVCVNCQDVVEKIDQENVKVNDYPMNCTAVEKRDGNYFNLFFFFVIVVTFFV